MGTTVCTVNELNGVLNFNLNGALGSAVLGFSSLGSEPIYVVSHGGRATDQINNNIITVRAITDIGNGRDTIVSKTAQSFARFIIDALNSSDAINRSTQSLNRTTVDSANSVDVINKPSSPVSRTTIDSVNGNDIISNFVQVQRVTVDAINGNDLVIQTKLLDHTILDVANGNDFSSRLLISFNRAVIDSINGNDIVIKSMPSSIRTVTDIFNGSDIVLPRIHLNRILTDILNGSDLLTRTQTFNYRNIIDLGLGSDIPVRNKKSINRFGSDIANGRDLFTRNPQLVSRRISDIAFTSESIFTRKLLTKNSYETLPTIIDISSKNWIFNRIINDSIPLLVENITRATSSGRPVAPICTIVSITISDGIVNFQLNGISEAADLGSSYFRIYIFRFCSSTDLIYPVSRFSRTTEEVKTLE